MINFQSYLPSIPQVNQESLILLIRTAYYRARNIYRVYQDEDTLRLMQELDHIYQKLLIEEKQRKKAMPRKETKILYINNIDDLGLALNLN